MKYIITVRGSIPATLSGKLADAHAAAIVAATKQEGSPAREPSPEVQRDSADHPPL